MRWRWKLERAANQLKSLFGFGGKENARPKLCPACGTLVGATATRCHQCGASLTFSLAALSRSLSGLVSTEAPVTYALLISCSIMYVLSFLITLRAGGVSAPGGGLFGIFNIGAISGQALYRLGMSLPWPLDLIQPWRLVMAVFLHGSLLHIGFNMWVLYDIGPQIEELYGSARYLFIYIFTGICGYALSSLFGKTSIGASGAILGLIGVLLALTTGHRTAGMQMLRSQLIRWLIYIAIMGFMFPGIDNFAHIGGFVSGYLLGRIMTGRAPTDAESRKRAYALGWGTALVVVASFAFMIAGYIHTS